jgi:hypothetical protein
MGSILGLKKEYRLFLVGREYVKNPPQQKADCDQDDDSSSDGARSYTWLCLMPSTLRFPFHRNMGWQLAGATRDSHGNREKMRHRVTPHIRL